MLSLTGDLRQCFGEEDFSLRLLLRRRGDLDRDFLTSEDFLLRRLLERDLLLLRGDGDFLLLDLIKIGLNYLDAKGLLQQ